MTQGAETRFLGETSPAPKAWLSHNILLPGQTIALAPLAAVRSSGQLHNTAKSAVRALEIVELLGKSEGPLRAFEIAGATGLSPSSADQLLKTLVDSGYLVFDPVSKVYHISARLSMVGASLSSSYFPDDRLQHMVEAVHADLGRIITLLCSQGTYMQAVMRAPYEGNTGLRIPLFGSSSGAAWLAAQPDEAIATAIARCRRELEDLERDRTRIFKAIERVRSDGYAIGGLTIEDGLCGIGVALPPAKNGIVLVLSVTAPVAELKERQKEMVATVKTRIHEYLLA